MQSEPHSIVLADVVFVSIVVIGRSAWFNLHNANCRPNTEDAISLLGYVDCLALNEVFHPFFIMARRSVCFHSSRRWQDRRGSVLAILA